MKLTPSSIADQLRQLGFTTQDVNLDAEEVYQRISAQADKLGDVSALAAQHPAELWSDEVRQRLGGPTVCVLPSSGSSERLGGGGTVDAAQLHRQMTPKTHDDQCSTLSTMLRSRLKFMNPRKKPSVTADELRQVTGLMRELFQAEPPHPPTLALAKKVLPHRAFSELPEAFQTTLIQETVGYLVRTPSDGWTKTQVELASCLAGQNLDGVAPDHIQTVCEHLVATLAHPQSHPQLAWNMADVLVDPRARPSLIASAVERLEHRSQRLGDDVDTAVLSLLIYLAPDVYKNHENELYVARQEFEAAAPGTSSQMLYAKELLRLGVTEEPVMQVVLDSDDAFVLLKDSLDTVDVQYLRTSGVVEVFLQSLRHEVSANDRMGVMLCLAEAGLLDERLVTALAVRVGAWLTESTQPILDAMLQSPHVEAFRDGVRGQELPLKVRAKILPEAQEEVKRLRRQGAQKLFDLIESCDWYRQELGIPEAGEATEEILETLAKLLDDRPNLYARAKDRLYTPIS